MINVYKNLSKENDLHAHWETTFQVKCKVHKQFFLMQSAF